LGGVALLALVHGPLDRLGVGEDLIALGDVDQDAEPAARAVARSRRALRRVAGVEDALVDLEGGKVGQPMPPQKERRLRGARVVAPVWVRRV
jgi:L-alanine-DL-glutamate epimerase-like enolase superfamily enzyme